MTSSNSASLHVPWAPTLRGNQILACPVVADLIADQATPKRYMPNDARWAMSNLQTEMEGVTADGKAALEEGVVALWRLKVVEELGGNCKAWQDQVEAWLVRGPSVLAFGTG